MFEVNIGLLDINQKGNSVLTDGDKKGLEINLNDQHLMQFADINSDMFTDIIAVDAERKTVIIHIFDPMTSNYT
jgi:hypothetical protein